MLTNAAQANGRLAAVRPCAHVAVMRDAPSPELMAWLRRLPPRDRLAMMYAIADVFPSFKNAREWTVGIDDLLAELKPTSQEHGDIMAEGSRIGRTLKRQLKSDEPDQ
jgi:hypothetical protein